MLKINQHGTALLLALIIMSGLIIGGVTLGTVVVNEIRQSRQLDRAIISYYAAESGAERLLYDWRDTKDITVFTAPCNEQVNSEVGWSCASNVGTINQLSFNLKNFQVEEFPLYIPGQLNVPAGIDSAVITWFDANPSNLLEPWLEVTLLEWSVGNLVDFAGTRNIIKKAFKCSPNPAGSATCENITVNDFSTDKSYIFRLRALTDDIENITVQFYDGDSPNPLDFGNYIRVADFTGQYGGVKQGVRVRFPVTEPSSSLFDFVLFSEESLLKSIF